MHQVATYLVTIDANIVIKRKTTKWLLAENRNNIRIDYDILSF